MCRRNCFGTGRTRKSVWTGRPRWLAAVCTGRGGQQARECSRNRTCLQKSKIKNGRYQTKAPRNKDFPSLQGFFIAPYPAFSMAVICAGVVPLPMVFAPASINSDTISSVFTARICVAISIPFLQLVHVKLTPTSGTAAGDRGCVNPGTALAVSGAL